MYVARTSPSLAMSCSVSTPVASSTPRPRKAIAVESKCSVAAVAHNTTMTTKVADTIFSWAPSGPSDASAARAAAGAAGVAVTSGAISL